MGAQDHLVRVEVPPVPGEESRRILCVTVQAQVNKGNFIIEPVVKPQDQWLCWQTLYCRDVFVPFEVAEAASFTTGLG